MIRTVLVFVLLGAAGMGRAAGPVQEVWRTRYGNTVVAREGSRSVAVDLAGNIYAAGWVEVSELSDPQGVLTKYDPAGNELWSERVQEGEVVAIGLDAAGNIFVAGTLGRQAGFFVRKHEPDGRLLWSTRHEAVAGAAALAVSPAGEACVTGTRRGADDVFLTLKVDQAGKVLWESEHDGPRPRQGSDDDGFNDLATAITMDASGNAYVTGSSRTDDTHWEYATVKYAPAGNMLWARRLQRGDRPEWSYDMPRAIAVDSDGNVVVTGSAAFLQPRDDPNYDFLTVKYDAQGNQLWTASYDGPDGQGDEASALAIDSAGNVVISGASPTASQPGAIATVMISAGGKRLWATSQEIRSNAAPQLTLTAEGRPLVVVPARDSQGVSRFAIFRYASGGELLDEQYHDPPAPGLRLVSRAVVDPAGNLIAVATTGEFHLEQLAVLKAAPDGSLLWTAVHAGPGLGREQPVVVALDGSGNICLAGWTSSPPTNLDFAMLKLDPQGRVVWNARWAGPGSGIDRPAGLAVDAGGALVVAGHSNDSRAGNDYLTIKYGPEGNLLWEARYDSNGGIWGDSAQAVSVDPGGNVYVTGSSDGGTPDVVTIKYSPAGERLWLSRYDEPRGGTQVGVAMKIDDQGNAFVAGHAFESGSRYLLTLKLDREGNVVWAARHASGRGENLARALVLHGGSAIVLATSKDERGMNDYTVVKHTPDGSPSAVHFNGPGDAQDTPEAIAVDAEGNVYVTGTSNGDFATVKYSPNLELLWSVFHDGPSAGNDRATALAIDRSGLVYVAGTSSTADDDVHEYRVLCYGPDGGLRWVHASEGVRGQWGPLPLLAVASTGEVIVAGAVGDEGNGSDMVIYRLRDGSSEGAAEFVRGDANRDGVVDVSDAARALAYLFLSEGPPACLDAADSNDDGAVDVSDPVAVLSWLFLAGPSLPPPVGAPGIDPTPDGLTCLGPV